MSRMESLTTDVAHPVSGHSRSVPGKQPLARNSAPPRSNSSLPRTGKMSEQPQEWISDLDDAPDA
jgi:hypothetical protein